jgi:transposase
MVIESRQGIPARSCADIRAVAAISAVAADLGIVSTELLRKWIRQAEIDGGVRVGKTSDESAEIKALRKENAYLRRANEVLKSASVFFAAELDRPNRH